MDFKKFGIIVEAETTGCVIEIYVNDIPVGLCGLGAQRLLSLPVHEYLVDDENELMVIVNPGDTPATVRQFSKFSKPAWYAQPPRDPVLDSFMGITDDDDNDETNEQKEDSGKSKSSSEKGAVFSAKLSLYPVGATAGDGSGTPLIAIEWSSESLPALQNLNRKFPLATGRDLNPQLYPIQLAKKGKLGEMFGEPHWRRAEVLRLNEDTASEAKDLGMNIKDFIEDGNAEPILSISTDKYREVAAAYNISAEQRAEMFRQIISQKSQTEDWLFETLEDEEFSFRLCADGRLVECVGRDWKPIIRGIETDEGRFLYPMLIGKLEDKWLIMR